MDTAVTFSFCQMPENQNLNYRGAFLHQLLIVCSQEKIFEVTDEEAERILKEEKLKKTDEPASQKKAEEANGGGDDDEDAEDDKGIGRADWLLFCLNLGSRRRLGFV